MGTLHLVGGEKGGVGKSFTARLLAQYFVDSQKPFIGFDTDTSHATFTRFYSQFVSPVRVDNAESLDAIIDIAEANPEANIIVDLAAQTGAKLQRWMDDCGMFAMLEELGFAVCFWHVLDNSADATFLLNKALDFYANTPAKIVIVENRGRGGRFEGFENSRVYLKALELGACVMALDKLHESVTQKIDFNSYSFWAAANSRQCMKLTEAQRVRVWLKNSYAQVDQIILGLK